LGLIADETSDVGHHEQLAVVVRYFDEKRNRPDEVFVGLRRLKTDAQSIFNELDALITELCVTRKQVKTVSFDGAPAMSGEIQGVQAKCKEQNPEILFVHCFAHCLNLVLTKTCGKEGKHAEHPKVVDFFGALQVLYNFIERSPLRHGILEDVAKQAGEALCQEFVHYEVHLSSRCCTCYQRPKFPHLLRAVEEATNASKNADVKATGLGLLHQLKSFDFILCLHFLDPILQLIWKLNKTLQTPNLNLVVAMDDVATFREKLVQLRTEEHFSRVLEDVVKTCASIKVTVPDVKKRRVSTRVDDQASTQHFLRLKKRNARLKLIFPSWITC